MDANVDKWSSLGSRLFFAGAMVLFVVAVLEWILGRLGVAAKVGGYESGRLVEFAAMFLIPVVTVLLRQIRQELRKKNA